MGVNERIDFLFIRMTGRWDTCTSTPRISANPTPDGTPYLRGYKSSRVHEKGGLQRLLFI